MKYYFCLVPKEDKNSGVNIGKTYAYKNKSKWVEAPADEFCKYLTIYYF